ncbi:MAG: undecaprenyldiphospho-muramoylpentapeptide beta-N-acetylglucosaminyltransferase [Alphaproteobacteria bacterium]
MNQSSQKLVVLAAGGSGGHVFPAEALATELSGRGCRLSLITDRRGDAYGGTLGDLETHRILAGGIAGKSLAAKMRSAPELAWGTLQARGLLKRMQPSAVVGFGGYASVPTMLAATFGGYASAIHEQNAVLGRANRLLGHRVRRIATSFADTVSMTAEMTAKSTRTGMPVRAAVIDEREVPYPQLDEASPIDILVTGGSQGARILSDVVPAALARLDDDLKSRLHVTQQCRPEDLDRVRAAYATSGIASETGIFFSDIPRRLAACHLLIGRAGASTVAEATVIGRPAILVPYLYAIDDHQSFNAHALGEAGGGWLMAEETFTVDGLAQRLGQLLRVPALLIQAAAASRQAGRPDAAARLADMVFELIDENGERRAA